MNKKLSRTCIAIIKNRRGKLIMAGDRRVSEDWSYAWPCPNPKISKTNNVLVGASGDSWLCKFVIDIFSPPKIPCKEPDIYMFYYFRNKLIESLKAHGYVDSHKQLDLPANTHCRVLVGVLGRAYTMDICNNSREDSSERERSHILLDDAPLPYAIGCGASSAIPTLITEKNSDGYNTKEILMSAMQLAAEISPGCSLPIDILSEE